MNPPPLHNTLRRKVNFYFVLEHFLGYRLLQKWFGKNRETLFNRIAENLAKAPIPMPLEVPQASAELPNQPGKAWHDQLKKPMLFKGAAAHWPSTKKWTLDFFAEEYGNLDVYLVDTPGAIDKKNPQEFEKISLRDYIGQMKNGSLKYLKFSNLVQEKMNLQQDLDLKWLNQFDTATSFGRRFYMFMGAAGTITPLHNEFPGVVYIQVSGKKKWIMYDAEERYFLDPRAERRHYFYTDADPNLPQQEEYPLMPYARRYEVTLEPGDVLWFPPFAWHHVENLTESIGVAYKFNDVVEAFKITPMLTSLYLMATRPFLIYNFFAMRFTKKYVDTTSSK